MQEQARKAGIVEKDKDSRQVRNLRQNMKSRASPQSIDSQGRLTPVPPRLDIGSQDFPIRSRICRA